MKLKKEEIQHIAKLARLDLNRRGAEKVRQPTVGCFELCRTIAGG